MRVPLAAVPEDRDLPRQEADVARLDHFDHGFLSLADGGGAPPRLSSARTTEADPSGACELAHAVRADELLEGVELLRPADDLERERLAADVRHARVEHLTELDQLRALVRRRADGDERELALHRLVRGELGDAQDVHELVHLLLDLLERVLGAVDAQGEPRDAVALRGADREAHDVVTTPGEHLRHANERARLVLQLDTDGVMRHQPVILSCSNSSSGISITSTDAAPAGTIG